MRGWAPEPLTYLLIMRVGFRRFGFGLVFILAAFKFFFLFLLASNFLSAFLLVKSILCRCFSPYGPPWENLGTSWCRGFPINFCLPDFYHILRL